MVVLCIFSPRCDRLKVTRAGSEITAPEITPAQELKREKQTAHSVCMEMGRGVARKPQDLKMHMT